MARDIIQTVPHGLPRPPGAQWEINALAPFPQRMRWADWGLNRAPYYHPSPVAAGGRLGEIYLGTDFADEAIDPATGEPIPLADRIASTATRSLRESAPGAELQTRAYDLMITVTSYTDGGPFRCACTPRLPFPCRIVGARMMHTPGETTMWNLFVVDDDLTGPLTELQGYPLINPVLDRDSGTAPINNEPPFGPITQFIFTQPAVSDFAQTLIGANIPADKHLALIAESYTPANAFTLDLVLTVQEVYNAIAPAAAKAAAVAPREPKPIPTPQSAAAAKVAAAAPSPKPAAPPPPPPPPPKRQGLIGAATSSAQATEIAAFLGPKTPQGKEYTALAKTLALPFKGVVPITKLGAGRL